MEKKIRVAIVGASGLVGRKVLEILAEKKLMIDEYVLFASSRSAGKTAEFLGQGYTIEELKEDSFDSGFDYAIFSAGGTTSLRFAPIAAKKGCVVIDNSSAFRMDENVPLIVPEVNKEEIKNNQGIIANPNCTTIPATVVLKPLDDKYHIKRIVYSTYQAVSGAGQGGIGDLENGMAGKDPEKFIHPIYNNCLPHIDDFLPNGYTKEEVKMVNETRKILGRPDLKVTSTNVRVPVLNCHSGTINVEFKHDFDLEEVRTILSSSLGIIVEDDFENNIYPLALSADGKDEVFVGRLRRDESVDYGLNMWVVCDNIRKGAATNAIQILEELLKDNN